MRFLPAFAAAVLMASLSAARAQEVAAGEQIFKSKCFICHAVGQGATNKIGPQLNGLDGRKTGSAPEYDYSDANKKSGIVWNEQSFGEYIKNPQAKVPGTKMAFVGIQDDKEIANLWAYLKRFGPDGKIK
ncbi:MAG TPA: cytochrome c family protein [Xanthobacteraceae bacterium]|nr:cytochrome c family protein [Xanthobacteraceae bacterium]